MRTGGELLAYLGSLMGLIAILERFIPRQLWDYINLKTKKFMSWASWQTEIIIDEYASNHNSNEVYKLAELYMSSLISDNRQNSAERIYFSQVKNAAKPSYKPGSGETVDDKFEGVTFHWQYREKQPESRGPSYFYKIDGISRKYTVTAPKRYKYSVLPRYMDFIVTRGKELRHQVRDRFLYTNVRSSEHAFSRSVPWKKVTFKHASTFESLALAPQLKQTIIEDLNSFMHGEEFYKRVGRAWKRGYLLFGPPGTGKSSLIAAIANHTGYDVYDLELTEVKSNSNLRELLIGISNKAIIVIEDIDCSVELKKRGKPAPDTGTENNPETESSKPPKPPPKPDQEDRVTLSGLLNFIDGLWSCIESERIIIFTTNHKELLDPALLRTGRMDLQIHMSYCCFEAFKTLAWTYLRMREHRLFGEVQELIGVAEMTPSDVAELLIQKNGDPDAAVESVVKALKEPERKKKKNPVKDGGCSSDEAKGEVDEELTVPMD